MSNFNKGPSLLGASIGISSQGSRTCALLVARPKGDLFSTEQIRGNPLLFLWCPESSEAMWSMQLGPLGRGLLQSSIKSMVRQSLAAGFTSFQEGVDLDELKYLVDELKRFNPDAFTPEEENFLDSQEFRTN